MPDYITICNSALTKVGANSIMGLDDNTGESNVCKLRFTECKNAVLRMHPWHCAIKRVILAPSTMTPAFGYEFQFPLPGDFLRLVSVNPETESDYKIENGMVLGDFQTLYLKYVSDTEDAKEISDELVGEAIASYLAWDICFRLTQSLSLKQQLAQEKKEAISKAKLANAQELPSPELEANLFLDARLGPVAANISEKRNW